MNKIAMKTRYRMNRNRKPYFFAESVSASVSPSKHDPKSIEFFLSLW
jgi:hypothetical protein